MAVDERWLQRAADAAAKREAARPGSGGAGAARTRRVVAHERACAGCGYNLQGVPSPGHCPECGRAFGFTRASEGGDELEALDDAQARVMHVAVKALLWGLGLLASGMLLVYGFALMPSLTPTDPRARYLIIAVLVLLGLPGGVAWLVGCVMLSSAPGDAEDGTGPVRGPGLRHRPAWMVWSVRGLAPGLVGGVLASAAAAWPGLDAEVAHLLEVFARVLLAAGCLSAGAAGALAFDLCARLGDERPVVKVTTGAWGVAACGAGLALSMVLREYGGWMGMMVGGVGYFAGWLLLPAVVAMLLGLWEMRAALGWSLVGVEVESVGKAVGGGREEVGRSTRRR